MRIDSEGKPKPVDWLDRMRGRGAEPTEDARAYHFLRGKLCMQALAFESREKFQGICTGAKLQSEFADETDGYGLNMSFESQLEKIKQSKTAKTDQAKIDDARTVGVCSFRGYLRKNHIFYMYQESTRANQ